MAEQEKEQVTFEYLSAKVSILLQATESLIEDVKETRKILEEIGLKFEYLTEKIAELKK
jgi:hypothetical protein